MKTDKNMKLLYQYAHGYNFSEFELLFRKMEPETPSEVFWEAYLMRAQLKLYTTDLTMLDDFAKAAEGHGMSQFPPLVNNWKSDGLNHFVVFPKTHGHLKKFVSLLPTVREKLSCWYGSQTDIVLMQLQSEILYFIGDIEKALPLAELQRTISGTHIDAILALILKFRCYLALMQTKKAEQCMFDIIRHSKTYPECVGIYREFRCWANLTTGWCGDSPRFCEDEHGKKRPVLQDRLEGIRLGIAKNSTNESHIIEYAKNNYKDIYTMREYYMDWFHAMYWLSVDDTKQTEVYFHKIYEVTVASGIVMPIIECGAQSLPVLEYIKSIASELPLDEFKHRSAHYENCLNAYRS